MISWCGFRGGKGPVFELRSQLEFGCLQFDRCALGRTFILSSIPCNKASCTQILVVVPLHPWNEDDEVHPELIYLPFSALPRVPHMCSSR